MKRKAHNAEFKFKVAIAAIRGEKTAADLCQEFGIVSSQLHKWKILLRWRSCRMVSPKVIVLKPLLMAMSSAFVASRKAFLWPIYALIYA